MCQFEGNESQASNEKQDPKNTPFLQRGTDKKSSYGQNPPEQNPTLKCLF